MLVEVLMQKTMRLRLHACVLYNAKVTDILSVDSSTTVKCLY